MKIYTISDMHFNHRSMILFGKRPFKNLKEMHDTIIENWNDVVDKNDMILILGDFGGGDTMFFRWILGELNGEKILIKGNHDHRFRLKKMAKENSMKIYKELSIETDNIDILLSHKPKNRKKYTFDINIHGHHHRKLLPSKLIQKYYYNVAVEHNNYRPKPLIKIIREKGLDVEESRLNYSIKNALLVEKSLVFA